jgi:metal-responsive CopG/Arc/MetJ family transcriptional regulator
MVSVTLDVAVLERIDRLADRAAKSRSEVMALLIEDALAVQSGGRAAAVRTQHRRLPGWPPIAAARCV